jgi:hypothetical protein
MRRAVGVTLAAVVGLWGGAGWAQEPRWTAQVDPLTTALGFVHLQVEGAVGPRVSVYAGPHARLFDSLLDDKKEDYWGLGVEVGVRYFFWEDGAPFGWWVLARGVLAGVHGNADDAWAVGGYGSGLGGYTGLVGGWLVWSGGAGVQYLHYKVGELGVEGVFPALHTALGVAW